MQANSHVLNYRGNSHVVADVVSIASRSRITKVRIEDLNLDDENVNAPKNFSGSEIIYTEQAGETVLLLGHTKVALARELEREEIPGRFISAFALKKARI